MLFLYLVLSFFYLYEQTFPPLIPYIVMAFGGGGTLFLLYLRNKQEISLMRMLPILIMIATAGGLLGYPYLYAIGITIGIGWRSISNVRETVRSNDSLLFFLSLIGAFLFYLFSNSSSLRSAIFLFPLLQFLLLLVCRAATEIRNANNPFQARWASGSILLLLSLSSGLFLIMIAVKDYLLNAISYLFGALAYGIGLPFYWLSLYLESRSKQKDITLMEDQSSTEAEQEEVEKQVLEQGQNIPVEEILYVVVAIAFFVLAISLYRKRFVLSRFKLNPLAVTVTNERVVSKGVSSKEERTPKDATRQQLYRLEMKAMKYGLGRRQNETVADWLDRLPSEGNKRVIIEVYERVRYGEMVPNQEEALLYKKLVKSLLQDLKTWHTSKKREENKQK